MKSSIVFISYSHDTPEHMDRVLALSDQLREEGIDCTVDQYVDSPPEGWPKWMDRQIEDSDFVLVICTEIYCRRVMDKEKPTVGKGVKWESTLTYQDIYDADAKNTKFIPVLLDPNDAKYIPKTLKGATYYCVDTEDGYEKLYRRLTKQPSITKPELGKLKALPVRKRNQVYEEHTRELVPPIEFEILSHRCELSETASDNSHNKDVFLSHNNAQKNWTRDLASKLRAEGFRVWFDEWCLRTGENWIRGLARGVEESKKIVLVLSPDFLDAEWPIFETSIAILGDPAARLARILPLIHTSCDLPPELEFRQALDFTDTHGDALRYEFRLAQLMADLDPSRDRPTDFDRFCATRDGP